jgi:hypothetical protein
MTPTSTPTNTPTNTPIPCCTQLDVTVAAFCRADPVTQGIDIDYYADVTDNCTGDVEAYVSYTLEITTDYPPDPNGNWTAFASTAPVLHHFPHGQTTHLTGTFSNQMVPPDATFYRVKAHVDQGSNCNAFDQYSDIDYICTNTLIAQPSSGAGTPAVSPTMHHW